MNLAQMKQGSDEWLQWRRSGIGGSDAPVIMGVSPWMTVLELWRIKTGLASEPEVNDAMRRGTEMEPIARAAYEAETGNVVEPICVQHPEHEWLRASLDGRTFDGNILIEVKCPGRSAHNEAKEGRVPDYYFPQVQHILMANPGAEELHYWSFDGNEGVLIPVKPDPDYQKEMFEKERAFWWQVTTQSAPVPPAYEGTATICAPEMLAIAASYCDLLVQAEKTSREIDRLKAKLLSVCTAATNLIGPIKVVRARGRMNLDQKALEAAGIDLAPYRKQGSDYWTVKIER